MIDTILALIDSDIMVPEPMLAAFVTAVERHDEPGVIAWRFAHIAQWFEEHEGRSLREWFKSQASANASATDSITDPTAAPSSSTSPDEETKKVSPTSTDPIGAVPSSLKSRLQAARQQTSNSESSNCGQIPAQSPESFIPLMKQKLSSIGLRPILQPTGSVYVVSATGEVEYVIPHTAIETLGPEQCIHEVIAWSKPSLHA